MTPPSVRLFFVLLAGLALTGCATHGVLVATRPADVGFLWDPEAHRCLLRIVFTDANRDGTASGGFPYREVDESWCKQGGFNR